MGEEMRKERRYLDLVKYIVFSAIKYVKTKIKAFWKGLRKEHAIISFLYPLDDETTVVTDPQVAQIFWNMLLSEVMALAMLYDNDDDGPIISIKIVIMGFIAAGICAGSGMLCRAVFRWGNKGKRFQRRVKEKKAAKKELKPGDDRGGAEVNDADRMKQAFQKAKEPKKRSLREIVDCGRITLAWVFNIAFYLIIEPFEVVLLVALPFLFDNKCVANCRQTAKELGLLKRSRPTPLLRTSTMPHGGMPGDDFTFLHYIVSHACVGLISHAHMVAVSVPFSVH